VNRAEAGGLVSLLADAYPHVQVRKGTAEAYAIALADLSLEEAHRAVVELLGTSKFWPTIAEIRELVARHRTGLPDAETAWAIVVRSAEAANAEISTRGSYQRVPFGCELIERAVAVIGWERIRSGEDRSILSAQFRKLYETWRAGVDRRVALGQDPEEAMPRRLGKGATFAQVAHGMGILPEQSLLQPSGVPGGENGLSKALEVSPLQSPDRASPVGSPPAAKETR
jgi:hypothetical protein